MIVLNSRQIKTDQDAQNDIIFYDFMRCVRYFVRVRLKTYQDISRHIKTSKKIWQGFPLRVYINSLSKTYQDKSRYIKTLSIFLQDGSRHIKTYQDEYHSKTYQDISRHADTGLIYPV